MNLLFLDTYYVEGSAGVSNWLGLIKDLAPFLAIIATLIITYYDRRDNSRNRDADLKRAEQNRIEDLKIAETNRYQDLHRIEKIRREDFLKVEKDKNQLKKEELEGKEANYKKAIEDFNFYFQASLLLTESHINNLNGMLSHFHMEKLKPFNVLLLSNQNIKVLLQFEYEVIRDSFSQIDYAQFIASIDLLNKLYDEIDLFILNYRSQYKEIHEKIHFYLHSIFYLADLYKYSAQVPEIIKNNLDGFQNDYKLYYKNYDVNRDVYYVSKVDELRLKYFNAPFHSQLAFDPNLKDIIFKLYLAICELERFVENHKLKFIGLLSGIELNFERLKDIKLQSVILSENTSKTTEK